MNMRNAFTVAATACLASLLAAACSPPTPDAKSHFSSNTFFNDTVVPPSTQTEYDWTTILARTDEVDVCTAEMSRNYERWLGPDYLTERFVRSTCKCARDLYAIVLGQDLKAIPSLENAFVQLAFNFDSVEFMNVELHPNAMASLIEYLDTRAATDFGFNHDDWERVSHGVPGARSVYDENP